MILFCGDPHGEFSHIREAAIRYPDAHLVILGDLQAQKPLHEELVGIQNLWFIHGNHDTDSESDFDNLFLSEIADRNVHARVADLDGLKLAGLGGVFRGQIWMPPQEPYFMSPVDYLARSGKGNWWRGGLPRKHRSSIFPSDYNLLASLICDVLVTHEAPSGHRHGFSEIDALAKVMGARLVVHGHHHENTDYQTTNGVRMFGVGYRCIRNEYGNVIFDRFFS